MPGPEKGIDYFFGFTDGKGGYVNPPPGMGGYVNPLLMQRTAAGSEVGRYSGHLNEILTDHFIQSMGTAFRQGRNFFGMLWHFAPHNPFIPPERWAAQYPDTEAGRRAALIRSLDESVGRVVTALQRMGKAENTIFVFTSDNGMFVPGRGEGRQPNGERGGKDTFYEGGIHVPLIVTGPGMAPGSESRALVSSMDFFQTLAEMAGIDASPLPSDGRSFASILRGRVPDPSFNREGTPLVWEMRDKLFTYSDKMIYAVIEGSTGTVWKLISHGSSDSELYNLDQDPYENTNVAAENPAVVHRLRGHYRRWRWGTGKISYRLTIPDRGPTNHVRVRDGEIEFDGRPGVVLIENHPRLDPEHTSFSLSVWFNVKEYSPSAQNSIVAAKGNSWRLLLRPSGHLLLRLFQHDGSEVRLSAPEAVPLNHWTHVSFTLGFARARRRKGSSVWPGLARLWVDGVKVRERETDRIPESEEAVQIGSSSRIPFKGKMKDLSFYSIELNEDEVNQLTAKRPPPIPSGSRHESERQTNRRNSPPPRPDDPPLEPINDPEPSLQAEPLRWVCDSLARAGCRLVAIEHPRQTSPGENVRREPIRAYAYAIEPSR